VQVLFNGGPGPAALSELVKASIKSQTNVDDIGTAMAAYVNEIKKDNAAPIGYFVTRYPGLPSNTDDSLPAKCKLAGTGDPVARTRIRGIRVTLTSARGDIRLRRGPACAPSPADFWCSGSKLNCTSNSETGGYGKEAALKELYRGARRGRSVRTPVE